MNPLVQLGLGVLVAFVVGAAVGVTAAMFQKAVIDKLVDDTLKDNDHAWDFVRMAGAAGVAIYLGGWVAAIIHDPNVIVVHANDFGLGLVETLGAYAGAVVGHSWAKK